MAQGDELLLTEADDNFHPLDDPWQTEGSWWSFHVPGTSLMGWIYHLTRLARGVASGGVWIWDDAATSCFEVPYYLNHYHQQLGAGPHDLNDFTWPDGTRLRTIQPLNRYRLTFQDRDSIALDLTFDGLTSPYVSAAGEPRKPFRLEQPCRVTGNLTLHGQIYAVECIGMRDHSWGIRGENTLAKTSLDGLDPLAAGEQPIVYLYGTASAREGFFAMLDHGYLLRDGERRDLVRISQKVTRDPLTGAVTDIIVTGEDNAGRPFTAKGSPRSLIVRPSNSGIGMIYAIEWDLDGIMAQGDLQDVWPIDIWSAYRRAMRAT